MFSNKKLLSLAGFGALLALSVFLFKKPSHHLTEIAIANWGPHSSLEETVRGLKEGLLKAGYKDGEQIHFDESHVNFDPSLVGQMLAKLKALKPAVLVTLSTPVAQRAKAEVKDIPLVFTDVTDPVSAGLIEDEYKAGEFITGASERQDLDAFLDFVMKFIPHAQKIGVLFATSEANDRALVKMMESAAAHHSMEVIALPVDEPRDIPIRMQKFRNSVDFIYVGTSGPIQPSFPAILSEADRMKIPVFNADSEHVKQHQAFGAFAVSFYQVGLNTAKIVTQILEGKRVQDIAPIFPTLEDHAGFVSRRKAVELGIEIPNDLKNVTVVE